MKHLRFVLLFACVVGLVSLRADTTVVREELALGNSMDLEAFRARIAEAHPDMDIVSLSGNVSAQLTPRPQTGPSRIAVFVKNQSTRREFDDEVDGLRDVIGASLAGVNLVMLDPSDVVAGFHRYKVTTREEREGLIDGLFTGGSTVRIAQMINADYLVLVSLVNADARSRVVNQQNINTYQVMLSVRVLESGAGSSVFGQNFQERYPVSTAGTAGSDIGYYRDLLYQAAPKIGQALASSSASWRRPDERADQLASFSVRTTIDELIDGLESGVRAPNELLHEMRRIVGGVTVELNGAAIGSAPGTFRVQPGMHQLRVTRQWMQPWQQTVHIQEGSEFVIGLELSDAGLARYQSLEGFRAMTALAYAEAAMLKGVTINFDTGQWRDVAIGTSGHRIQIND